MLALIVIAVLAYVGATYEMRIVDSWTTDECTETHVLASIATDDYIAQEANGMATGSVIYAFGSYSATTEKEYQYTVVEGTEDGGLLTVDLYCYIVS